MIKAGKTAKNTLLVGQRFNNLKLTHMWSKISHLPTACNQWDMRRSIVSFVPEVLINKVDYILLSYIDIAFLLFVKRENCKQHLKYTDYSEKL